MAYETIIFKETSQTKIITINRLNRNNSINALLLEEINNALDRAQQDNRCRMIVLEGQEGVFCTGMDFTEAVNCEYADQTIGSDISRSYMETIKRFSKINKLVISKVDGKVMAGGVGLVSASDLVVATPRAEFSLSEALWGLLPAMVMPYLIRRVGFQPAYRLTMTTLPINGQEAFRIGLVDELSEKPEDNIRKLANRLGKLELSTIVGIKEYFRKMWLINDEMERFAVEESYRLMSDPGVRNNIENFVKHKKFPWE